jgi:hypothetical protein
LYHSSNNIQFAASVDVPGFGEPRKSACLCFYLCLLSVHYVQQIGITALCSKLQNFQSSQILILTSCGDSSHRYESDDIKIIKIGVETSPVELAEVSPAICRKNQTLPEFRLEKTATSSDMLALSHHPRHQQRVHIAMSSATSSNSGRIFF